jgi:hypothetical protein
MKNQSPRNTEKRVANLSPVEKKIMKEFKVSATAAIKAAEKFKKLEIKTQKIKPNSMYSFDQKGLNYSKATKNLLKNQ